MNNSLSPASAESMVTPFRFWDRGSILFYGLLLFCATLPFHVRYNNIATVMILVGWVVENDFMDKVRQFKKNKDVGWIIVYYLISVATLIYSANTNYGVSVLETQLMLFVIPLVVASASSLTDMKILLLKSFFAGWCIFVSMGLLTYNAIRSVTDGVNHFYYYDLTDPLDLHPIYFANYLVLAGLIIYFTDFKMKDTLQKIVKTASLLFIGVFIAMLSAISVLFFVIAFLAVILNHRLHFKYGFWKAQLISLTLVILLMGVSFTVPYTRNKVLKSAQLHYKMDDPDSAWNSVTIRLAKWTGGLKVIRENPLLGTGVGDEMDELMGSYAAINFKEGIRCHYNVHNQYLSSAMSGGVFLSVSLLAMLMAPLALAIRRKDFLLLSFMILISFSFLTENFLRLRKGVAFFSLFYPVLILRKNSMDEV